MKSEQIYQHLKELAEKLDVTVTEKNLKDPGVPVKSGLCKIKGKHVFIMDKRLPVAQKARILALCLKDMPHEDIYLAPAVRDYLSDGNPKADTSASPPDTMEAATGG